MTIRWPGRRVVRPQALGKAAANAKGRRKAKSPVGEDWAFYASSGGA